MGPAAGRFLLAPRIAIEQEDRSTVTIYHLDSGARCKISRALYNLMNQFREPASIATAAPLVRERLALMLRQLAARGFLLNLDDGAVTPPRGRLTPVPATLFRAPALQPGGPPAQVAVVGLPYDAGNIIAPGAREGPSQLRQSSWQYQYLVNFATRLPAGWYDPDTDEDMLCGVTICDWGNVRFIHGEDSEAIFSRLEAVAAEMIGTSSFPVLLGGDHSVSYAFVRALASAQPLSVVWLDAHLDCGDLEPGLCHNHKNVVTKLIELPNVRRVTNVGLRGFLSGAGQPQRKKLEIITARRLREQGIEPVLEALPPDCACYISLDIDVLDPVYAPGTSTPVPFGLDPGQLKDLLRHLGRERNVVGFDLVEVNPDRDREGVTSLLACELLLSGLGAAMARRTPGSQLTSRRA
jgi:agmatinase